MTSEEMLDLLCEYGGEMKVSHHIHDPEVYDGGCNYELSYKGIICGSELVEPWFVRDYINRQIKPIRG